MKRVSKTFLATGFAIVLAGIGVSRAVSAADVYYYDDNGTPTFTDNPHKGKPITVKPLPTVSLPKSVDDVNANSTNVKQTPMAKGYTIIHFTYPQNDAAFWSGNGNIVLTVESKPPLRNGDQFSVTMDGNSLGSNASGQFAVEHIDRGTHTASVSVVTGSGDVVQAGQSITFTVHRHSVLRKKPTP